jgi:hypothetical protein
MIGKAAEQFPLFPIGRVLAHSPTFGCVGIESPPISVHVFHIRSSMAKDGHRHDGPGALRLGVGKAPGSPLTADRSQGMTGGNTAPEQLLVFASRSFKHNLYASKSQSPR